MISLFQNKTFPFLGVTTDARSEYGLAQLRTNIHRLQEYMRTRNFTAPNQHPLVGLLHQFTIPPDYEIMYANDIAYTRSRQIARMFNFTSSSNRGKPWQGVFFGGKNQEMVLGLSEYHPTHVLTNHWGDLQPVKVHYHPWSDFSMVPANGVDHRSVTGDVYMSVDISMLLMMFYFWQNKQLRNQSINLSAASFVAAYVIPNMLPSYMDVCVMNMYRDMVAGTERTTAKAKLPFTLPDVAHLLRHDVKKAIERTQMRAPLDSILADLPSLYQKDLLTSMRLPSMPRVMQLWWWVLGCRLPIMNMLFANPKLVRANSFFAGEAALVLRMAFSDGTLGGIDRDLSQRIYEQMQELDNKLKGV